MNDSDYRRFMPRHLSVEDRGKLEWHVDHCPECQTIMQAKTAEDARGRAKGPKQRPT